MEFSDFVEETQTTFSELHSIAERASFHVTNLKTAFPGTDASQIWSLSIGLAKLQGDPKEIGQRFLFAVDLLRHFDCTLENKMMAGEIMTASRGGSPSQTSTNSDLQDTCETLKNLDHQIRHDEHVPNALSVGVAATMLFGRQLMGHFPLTSLWNFRKLLIPMSQLRYFL